MTRVELERMLDAAIDAKYVRKTTKLARRLDAWWAAKGAAEVAIRRQIGRYAVGPTVHDVDYLSDAVAEELIERGWAPPRSKR